MQSYFCGTYSTFDPGAWMNFFVSVVSYFQNLLIPSEHVTGVKFLSLTKWPSDATNSTVKGLFDSTPPDVIIYMFDRHGGNLDILLKVSLPI